MVFGSNIYSFCGITFYFNAFKPRGAKYLDSIIETFPR